jgi:hypothetical protein
MLLLGILALILAVAGTALLWQVHQRRVERWIVPYLLEAPRRRAPRSEQEVHLLLCIADHYEPRANRATPEVARARVRRWVEDYPRQFARFRDSDGRTPRHTFFYPLEEYEPEHLDALAELCAAGFGEVEVHLHHDRDTQQGLREKLLWFKDVLAKRHGLLSHRRGTGEIAYGFIHGNWALCNSRPDGRWCGVDQELSVLRETGCYADFTLPAAPSGAQTSTINKIYYARDIPGRRRSHDRGLEIARGPAAEDALMLIQGPLLLDWGSRKWGLLPRLENACLQPSQPPSITRLPLWLKARVQVRTRPDWFFVKLHAHGAVEESHEILLGGPMVRFHEELAAHAARHPRFHYHYVSAREMYNLARAAEAGWTGSVADALDRELVLNRIAPAPPALTRESCQCTL